MTFVIIIVLILVLQFALGLLAATIEAAKEKQIWNTFYCGVGFICAIIMLFAGIYTNFIQPNIGENVYICTGLQSHAYHIRKNCKGLKHCSRSIKKISIDDAEDMHRHPCRYCCDGQRPYKIKNTSTPARTEVVISDEYGDYEDPFYRDMDEEYYNYDVQPIHP